MARETPNRPPSVHPDRESARSVGSLLAVIAGGLVLLASLVPGLFPVAWTLGGMAIVVSSRILANGADRSESAAARLGRGLGVAGVVLGVLNLGIVLGLFDYFTGR